MATPLGLSCTLPPSCFTFFLPLLVSFVSRLGLVRLDSVLLGPQTDVSLSLRLSFFLLMSGVFRSLARSRGPSSCPCCTGPRPPPGPLDPLAGPHGYQPLVFTSGQLGGGFDKTTSKLKHPPASLRPATCPRLARSSGARRTHGAARDREKEERRRKRGDNPHDPAHTERRWKPEKRVHRRVDAHVQEDLSKQKPGLSSSHVLRTKRKKKRGRRRGKEGRGAAPRNTPEDQGPGGARRGG